MLILCLVMMLVIQNVEDVHVQSEISRVIEDTSINSSPLIPNEIPMSSESTIDVVEALVDSNTPIPDETYVHEDNQGSEETKIEYIVAIPSVFSSTKSKVSCYGTSG